MDDLQKPVHALYIYKNVKWGRPAKASPSSQDYPQMFSASFPLILSLFPLLSCQINGETIHLRQVSAPSVTQYWNTRCATDTTYTTTLPQTTELFEDLPLVDVYLTYESNIYFAGQYNAADLSLSHLSQVTLQLNQISTEAPTTYYLVAPDYTNPGAARLDQVTGTLNLKTGCVAHFPILAPFITTTDINTGKAPVAVSPKDRH